VQATSQLESWDTCMSFQSDLQQKIELFDGTAERELTQRKIDAAYEMDEHSRDRRAKRAALAQTYRRDAVNGGVLPTIAALTPHETRNYSLSRLLRDMLPTGEKHSLEKDISASIEKDLGVSTRSLGGLFVPLRLTASGLDTLTTGTGKYLQQQTVGQVIDYLQASSKVLSLGAEMVTGLRFACLFPVEDSPSVATWITDDNPGTDVDESDVVLSQRNVRPHTLQTTTSFSRQLLQQNSVGIEQWLRRKLGTAHAIALDAAAISGTGLDGQPVGLLECDNVGSGDIGDNGGAVAASHLVALEKLVGDSNGDSNTLGWLTNSAQRAKLRAVPSMASGTIPVWGDNNTVLGHRAEVSNAVPRTLSKGSAIGTCSAVLFGSWSSLALVEFNGAIELLLDEYRLVKQGMIELTSFQTVDTLIRQPACFAAIQDAT
jgi:HK97 family phage major capsid protein